MKSTKAVFFILVLGVAGYFALRFLFPDERALVVRRLNRLAETATVTPDSSIISRGLKANKVLEFLTDDIEVVINMPDGRTLGARGEDIRTAVNSSFASAKDSKVDLRFYDIDVELNSDNTAAQVALNMVLDFNGEEAFLAQEWNVAMVKEESDWKIKRIETVAPYTRLD